MSIIKKTRENMAKIADTVKNNVIEYVDNVRKSRVEYRSVSQKKRDFIVYLDNKNMQKKIDIQTESINIMVTELKNQENIIHDELSETMAELKKITK